MEKVQRVLMVDGHALLKAGLCALLANEPDIEVFADSDNGFDVITAGGELAPHLLLLDRTMPGMNDIEAVARIRRRFPHARVLMIMPRKAGDMGRAGLRTGANGYIRKDATHEELRVAIRSVLQGKSYLDMNVSGNVINPHVEGGRPGTDSALDALTPRERDVLKLVAAGKSSREIAEILGLSVKTVGKHRSNLMAKLDLHNAAGLTAYAIERGLLF
jgi:DNA-binding NarL/FixJ family response regulator